MPFLRNSISAFILCLSTFSYAQKATYVANSGVLVQVGSSKVLIDGLFTEGYGRFSTPTDSQLDAMVAGQAPYNNLSLSLVTHAHADHLSPQQLAKMLFTQKELKCVSSPQTIDSVTAVMDDFSAVEKRLLAFPTSRTWKSANLDGINLKAAYARHPGKINAKVQDVIFILEMGGKSILHLGDADMDPDRFDELNLHYEEVDVAFVPFWYMSSFYGAELVKKYVKADKIVAVHFPEKGSPDSIAKIKKFIPGAIIFENPGQTVSF